jgi:hypothetical protein
MLAAKLPAGHGSQLVSPDESANVPDMHGKQKEVPGTALYDPDEHSRHTPFVLYSPGGQGMHTVPFVLAPVPAEQGMQS